MGPERLTEKELIEPSRRAREYTRRQILKKGLKFGTAVLLTSGAGVVINSLPHTRIEASTSSIEEEKTSEAPELCLHNALNFDPKNPNKLNELIANPEIEGLILEADATIGNDGILYCAHDKFSIPKDPTQKKEYEYRNVIERFLRETNNGLKIDVKLGLKNREEIDIVTKLIEEASRGRRVIVTGAFDVLSEMSGNENTDINPTVSDFEQYSLYATFLADDFRKRTDGAGYGVTSDQDFEYLPYLFAINQGDERKGIKKLKTGVFTINNVYQALAFIREGATNITSDRVGVLREIAQQAA